MQGDMDMLCSYMAIGVLHIFTILMEFAQACLCG
jgi:hypothetical protein